MFKTGEMNGRIRRINTIFTYYRVGFTVEEETSVKISFLILVVNYYIVAHKFYETCHSSTVKPGSA